MPAIMAGADSLKFSVSAVEVSHLHAIGSIPGVRIDFVAGLNGPGVAIIRSRFDGRSLSWMAPGSTRFGSDAVVTADGMYLLSDGDDANKYVRVEAYESFLPSGNRTAKVLLTDRFNNAVADDDVEAAEASAGDVKTWAITITNQYASDVHRVRVWLDASVGDLEISDDGSTWVAPDSESHADVLEFGSLAAAATATLHVRRTIGSSTASDADILNWLHGSFEGF